MGLNQYEIEKKAFEDNFKSLKKKRISIYGVGRFTATLVPMLSGWNIVGLLDKDSNNIGKVMFGVPVISYEDAKQKADAIIINTSASYWDTIYERIYDLGIPVYYRNGELAKKNIFNDNLPYWKKRVGDIENAIDNSDIISFDFFDTLFSRKVSSPGDIFTIVEKKLSGKLSISGFSEERKNAPKSINNKDISLHEIYSYLQNVFGLTNEEREYSYGVELEVQKQLLEPRTTIIELLKKAISKDKEVYVISDMYLPNEFFYQVLKEHDIDIPKNNIWVSAEKGFRKKDGGLWEEFQNEVIGSKQAVHIGDNDVSDVKKYKEYTNGRALEVMSPYCILKNSNIGNVIIDESNIFHSLIIGLATSRVFQNPYKLSETKGVMYISNLEDLGYSVFGPVVFSFLVWLDRETKINSDNKLLFVGRDGYFLQKDFEFYLGKKAGKDKGKSTYECSYLNTSRQILMSSGIETTEEAKEYASFPYVGTFEDYCRDRFFMELNEKDRCQYGKRIINAIEDYEEIIELLKPYYAIIHEKIGQSKKLYLEYLEKYNSEEYSSIIDLGFFGTTQYYLQKLMKREIKGYYIVADTSEENPFSKVLKMGSCTRIKGDSNNRYSNIHSKGLALESFLTAPSGMIRGMDKNGFIYSENRSNQKYFKDKERINEGVFKFICDMMEYIEVLDDCEIRIDKFIDEWWGGWISNSTFTDEVKRSFYNDNAFVHGNENLIFE